jgi:hypothetical protein
MDGLVGPCAREADDPAFNTSASTRAASLAQPEFLHLPPPPPRRRTHNAVPARSGLAGDGGGPDAAPLQRILSGEAREFFASPLPRAGRTNAAMGLLRTISVTSSVTGEITNSIDKYSVTSGARPFRVACRAFGRLRRPAPFASPDPERCSAVYCFCRTDKRARDIGLRTGATNGLSCGGA